MTASDLQDRLLERLGDTQSGEYVQVGYYTPTEALNWINAAQRLMVLLTLCLETTGSLVLGAGDAWYSMLSQYSDWMLPLRVRVTGGGAKLLPSRLSDLAALDAVWSVSPGVPARYALLGFDLFAVYQQPLEEMSLDITYARCPDPLVGPNDLPEVPLAYQPALLSGAIPLLRVKEGGGELEKVLPLWDEFMEACGKLGEYVRNRNIEQGYDRMPFEIPKYDQSARARLMKLKAVKVG